MIVDTKHIDSTEKALELGIHLVRHLRSMKFLRCLM